MRNARLILGILVLCLLTLIGFFVLSVTLSKPSRMTLSVPGSATAQEPVSSRRTLTLYLGANDQVFVLDRLAPTHPKAAGALTKQMLNQSLGRLVTNAQQQVKPDTLVCIIKPLPSASYTQIVKALDLMTVSKIKKYALVDEFTPTEEKLLAEKGKE